MPSLEPVELKWLVELVNEFSAQARAAAGEQSAPLPDLWALESAPSRLPVSDRDLLGIADRLWQTFTGTELERASSLTDLAQATSLTPTLDQAGKLQWATPSRSAADVLLARCAVTLVTAVSQLGWRRLGLCAEPFCQDVYIDVDGRGSRRYCSQTCLNRARVRAFRARQKRSG